jgi:hypothetical protein
MIRTFCAFGGFSEMVDLELFFCSRAQMDEVFVSIRTSHGLSFTVYYYILNH